MAWIRFGARGGVLKIKPRWQMRWAERNRRVWVMNLGIIIVSWWSAEDMERY